MRSYIRSVSQVSAWLRKQTLGVFRSLAVVGELPTLTDGQKLPSGAWPRTADLIGQRDKPEVPISGRSCRPAIYPNLSIDW
jgi:hypothetical protein